MMGNECFMITIIIYIYIYNIFTFNSALPEIFKVRQEEHKKKIKRKRKLENSYLKSIYESLKK